MLCLVTERSRTIRNNVPVVIWVECRCLGFPHSNTPWRFCCRPKTALRNTSPAARSKHHKPHKQAIKMHSGLLQPLQKCRGPVTARHLTPRHPTIAARPPPAARRGTGCAADPTQQPGEAANIRQDQQQQQQTTSAQQQQQRGVPPAPRKERDLVIPIAVSVTTSSSTILRRRVRPLRPAVRPTVTLRVRPSVCRWPSC